MMPQRHCSAKINRSRLCEYDTLRKHTHSDSDTALNIIYILLLLSRCILYISPYIILQPLFSTENILLFDMQNIFHPFADFCRRPYRTTFLTRGFSCQNKDISA